jgi:hypothetical protein
VTVSNRCGPDARCLDCLHWGVERAAKAISRSFLPFFRLHRRPQGRTPRFRSACRTPNPARFQAVWMRGRGAGTAPERAIRNLPPLRGSAMGRRKEGAAAAKTSSSRRSLPRLPRRSDELNGADHHEHTRAKPLLDLTVVEPDGSSSPSRRRPHSAGARLCFPSGCRARRGRKESRRGRAGRHGCGRWWMRPS